MPRLRSEASETPRGRLALLCGAEVGDVVEELGAGDVDSALNVDCEGAQFDAFGPAWGP